MGTLFLYAGVFALVTLIVAGVCEWFVRQEAKKTQRLSRPENVHRR